MSAVGGSERNDFPVPREASLESRSVLDSESKEGRVERVSLIILSAPSSAGKSSTLKEVAKELEGVVSELDDFSDNHLFPDTFKDRYPDAYEDFAKIMDPNMMRTAKESPDKVSTFIFAEASATDIKKVEEHLKSGILDNVRMPMPAVPHAAKISEILSEGKSVAAATMFPEDTIREVRGLQEEQGRTFEVTQVHLFLPISELENRRKARNNNVMENDGDAKELRRPEEIIKGLSHEYRPAAEGDEEKDIIIIEWSEIEGFLDGLNYEEASSPDYLGQPKESVLKELGDKLGFIEGHSQLSLVPKGLSKEVSHVVLIEGPDFHTPAEIARMILDPSRFSIIHPK
jgi:hypothetical protein